MLLYAARPASTGALNVGERPTFQGIHGLLHTGETPNPSNRPLAPATACTSDDPPVRHGQHRHLASVGRCCDVARGNKRPRTRPLRSLVRQEIDDTISLPCRGHRLPLAFAQPRLPFCGSSVGPACRPPRLFICLADALPAWLQHASHGSLWTVMKDVAL